MSVGHSLSHPEQTYEEDHVRPRQIQHMNVALHAQPGTDVARVAVLEREAGQRGDLDRQAAVRGVVAVDERGEHDCDAGARGEAALGGNDGEVDLAVGRVGGQRVDGGRRGVGVDLGGREGAAGGVVEDGRAAGVDWAEMGQKGGERAGEGSGL